MCCRAAEHRQGKQDGVQHNSLLVLCPCNALITLLLSTAVHALKKDRVLGHS